MLWTAELCWFYNMQSHMTPERYYVGFRRQRGALKPHPASLTLAKKHQMTVEERQSGSEIRPGQVLSMARLVISILLEKKDGEEPSVKSQERCLVVSNVHHQTKLPLREFRRENRESGTVTNRKVERMSAVSNNLINWREVGSWGELFGRCLIHLCYSNIYRTSALISSTVLDKHQNQNVTVFKLIKRP